MAVQNWPSEKTVRRTFDQLRRGALDDGHWDGNRNAAAGEWQTITWFETGHVS